jgi:hypothetical protein
LTTFSLGAGHYFGNHISTGRLGGEGRNGGAPIPKPLADKADRTYSAGCAILQSHEPLPPYELDSMFDDPVIRNRIGQVIAKAMEPK